MHRLILAVAFAFSFESALALAEPLAAAETDARMEAGAAADPDAAAETDATAQDDAASEKDAVEETGAVAEADAATPASTGPGRAVPPPPLGTRFPEPLTELNEVRIRYQWRRTKSQGLLLADRDARPGYVRDGLYLQSDETPRALDVTVHLVEVAYAPHPRTTLIVQVPFLQKDLETLEASGYRRHDQTDGLGDVQFALVVPFIQKGRESSHVHIAFDVPSGDYREEDGDGRRLPYDSQLGNGTFDFEWGWTYRGEIGWLAWGGQAVGRHPLGENGLDYREGSRFEASLWSSVRIFDGLSGSLRVQWQKQNNLSGRDHGFDPISDPAENGKARGGTRFLIGPGLAWDLPGIARGQRLALELAVPVHQDVDGPQLEQDWVLTSGWQWAF